MVYFAAPLGGADGPVGAGDSEPAAGTRCIATAESSSPAGPFTADPLPLACLPGYEQALSGLLFALREHGLSVPADVSVLAAASSWSATTMQPQISAADVLAEEMGRHAVEMLLRLLGDPSAPAQHILLRPPFEDPRQRRHAARGRFHSSSGLTRAPANAPCPRGALGRELGSREPDRRLPDERGAESRATERRDPTDAQLLEAQLTGPYLVKADLNSATLIGT